MRLPHQQQGAAAIEFSLVFPVFLALIYAIISYSLVFMLTQSFTYASEDALRAAVSVDCEGLSTRECIDDRITPAVRQQVVTSLAWLPDGVKSTVLGENGESIGVTCSGDTCTVEVRYKNYARNPLVPLISIPGIGTVPSLPKDVVGRASLRV